jgi:hypothetical protein
MRAGETDETNERSGIDDHGPPLLLPRVVSSVPPAAPDFLMS